MADQWILHAGGALVLWDRLRVGVDLPIALDDRGSSFTDGTTTIPAPPTFAAGDLRLGADVRVLGRYGGFATLALGLQAYLPTGGRDSYLSDGTVRLEPHALVAGDASLFVYAAELAFEYRPDGDTFDRTGLGSMVIFRAAAGVRVARGALVVGPEIFGSTVVTSGDAPFGAQNTPLDGLVGAHLRLGDFRVGAGAGAGLTRGIGSPDARVVASIEWAPPPENARPPTAAAALANRDDHEAAAGAPAEGEGHDRSPAAAPRHAEGCAEAGQPITAGCPPPANDAPLADRDGDGVVDGRDACPDVPGRPSDDATKNGCPLAYLRGDHIHITEQVQFRTSLAALDPASSPVLEAIQKVLVDHPEIKHLRVEGHTDNVGLPASNQALSSARASAVTAWLVAHGISPARLASVGYGMTRPLVPNDDEEGRRVNRRVEFRILAGDEHDAQL